MQRSASLLAILLAATAYGADEPTFTRAVTCTVDKAGDSTCPGLSISGDDISTITVKGIPTDGDVTVYIDAGVSKVSPPVSPATHPGSIEIPVHTKRAVM